MCKSSQSLKYLAVHSWLSCLQVLEQCSALHTLSLHNNPITPDTLADNPGFTAFERRRQGKYNKAIAGGVLLGTAGLDEGVDRKVAPRSP
jgi:hypothetical protein